MEFKANSKSTLHYIRLNHWMVLHGYQKEINKTDIRKMANKFSTMKDSRKKGYSSLQILTF